jgi:hypothetical protein
MVVMKNEKHEKYEKKNHEKKKRKRKPKVNLILTYQSRILFL